MRKYRYFGALLDTQEKWLNKMASNSYKLIRVEKLLYEFEKCQPNSYVYKIDFVASKSKSNSEDYKSFLEGLGYKVFYKNINLNYSVGKIRVRPWAEKGGRVATNMGGTFNKELLIVEKKADGKPFELHTDLEDKISYAKTIRNSWLTLFALCIFIIALQFIDKPEISLGIIVALVIAILLLFPISLYQRQVIKYTNEKRTNE